MEIFLPGNGVGLGIFGTSWVCSTVGGEMWPGIQQGSKIPVGRAEDPKLISGGDVFSALNAKRHIFFPFLFQRVIPSRICIAL